MDDEKEPAAHIHDRRILMAVLLLVFVAASAFGYAAFWIARHFLDETMSAAIGISATAGVSVVAAYCLDTDLA